MQKQRQIPDCLIAEAPALLDLAELLLREYEGERDCLYDGITIDGVEETAAADDLEIIREMDVIIDQARAVIYRAKGMGIAA